MSSDECKGCNEYKRLTRRNFVSLSASALAAAAVPAWLPRVVFAEAESSSRDVMVSVFLRGGVDSLSMCVPFGETAYYDLRPSLAVPAPDSGDSLRGTDLDGFFGFPASMAPLVDAYQDGDLLLIHACGLKESNRSHFDAMHFMEVGMGSPPSNLFTGWLGRHLAATAPTLKNSVLRAVGIGYGLQRTLAGAPQTLPINDLAEFGFSGSGKTKKQRIAVLEEIYAISTEPLASSAANTFRTVDTLKRIRFDSYKPKGGARYPDDEFGYSLRSTAALIKADVGIEAVAIDLGGWDTHDEQGTTEGHMAYLMDSFAKGLAAFHRDLASSNRRDVVTVAMSEFGRNAAENGSFGTDHGYGGLMLAMGDRISGGRVLTKWPGLKKSQLYEGQDLKITVDYRDVLGEIIARRLGNANLRAVFPDPGYSPKTLGVTV